MIKPVPLRTLRSLVAFAGCVVLGATAVPAEASWFKHAQLLARESVPISVSSADVARGSMGDGLFSMGSSSAAFSVEIARPDFNRAGPVLSDAMRPEFTVGEDAQDYWALAYSRCKHATWTTSSDCVAYYHHWDPTTVGFIDDRLNPESTASDGLPNVWGSTAAWIRDSATEVIETRDLTTQANTVVGQAPWQGAHATSLRLSTGWLAVAWSGTRAGRRHSEIQLIDLGTRRSRVVMRASAARGTINELISPAFLRGALYFARAAKHGWVYRYRLSARRVERVKAPANLSSFTVGPALGANVDAIVYSTAGRGGGSTSRCPAGRRCRVFLVRGSLAPFRVL